MVIYKLSAKPKVEIAVTFAGDQIFLKGNNKASDGYKGWLQWSTNSTGQGSSKYIARGALILKQMTASPKNSGVGAILVYEYVLLAKQSNTGFLGINSVAGTTPDEPTPRPFYGKMGFWDTLDSAEMKMDSGFQSMPDEQQAKALLSLPMCGVVSLVIEEAQKSWSKKWIRQP